jgi:predicted PurR-regulated permease PerM
MLPLLSSEPLLNFFRDAAAFTISLFVLFAVIIFFFTFGKQYIKTTASLSETLDKFAATLEKLDKSVAFNNALNEERDRKYMSEFHYIKDHIVDLNNNAADLKVCVAEMHNYCMARNTCQACGARPRITNEQT